MIDEKTTEKIKQLIDDSNTILLALHLSPDGDSVGSVLAMEHVLTSLKKKVTIVSGSEIPSSFKSFPGVDKIKIKEFNLLDFSKFDLFIALDSGQETMISRRGFSQLFPEKLKIVNLDHHFSNTRFGDINLIDSQASSTTEMLYFFFKKWKIPIEKELAQLLFLGLFSDTGCFQYPNCTIKTMEIAAELRKKGADLDKTVLGQFRSYSFNNLKYWALVLSNLNIDKSGKFVWSKTSLQEREERSIGPMDMEGAASLFCPVTEGTEFGIILDEQKGFIKVSLRSRRGFDVSKLAVSLGGGGHKLAAGFILRMNLKQAEKLVIKKARELL